MPTIPAIQKTEIWRIKVLGQPMKKISEDTGDPTYTGGINKRITVKGQLGKNMTLSENYKKKKRTESVVQEVDHLSGKPKVLNLNPQ
jgi:hypothetical protein